MFRFVPCAVLLLWAAHSCMSLQLVDGIRQRRSAHKFLFQRDYNCDPLPSGCQVNPSHISTLCTHAQLTYEAYNESGCGIGCPDGLYCVSENESIPPAHTLLMQRKKRSDEEPVRADDPNILVRYPIEPIVDPRDPTRDPVLYLADDDSRVKRAMMTDDAYIGGAPAYYPVCPDYCHHVTKEECNKHNMYLQEAVYYDGASYDYDDECASCPYCASCEELMATLDYPCYSPYDYEYCYEMGGYIVEERDEETGCYCGYCEPSCEPCPRDSSDIEKECNADGGYLLWPPYHGCGEDACPVCEPGCPRYPCPYPVCPSGEEPVAEKDENGCYGCPQCPPSPSPCEPIDCWEIKEKCAAANLKPAAVKYDSNDCPMCPDACEACPAYACLAVACDYPVKSYDDDGCFMCEVCEPNYVEDPIYFGEPGYVEEPGETVSDDSGFVAY